MGRILPIRARTTKRPRRLGLKAGDAWLQGVRQVRSPNCDDRPAGVDPSLVIVHGISLPSGQFGGPHIDQLFTNSLDPAAHPYFRNLAGIKVSSHLLIRRDGEVVQYVPLHRRAWHAGKSSFQGRQRCNDYSVGIELEGADNTPYTQAQYRRLVTVIRLLRRGVASLAAAPIVGHSDIAPGRKTDPGPGFDWPLLRKRLAPRTARRR